MTMGAQTDQITPGLLMVAAALLFAPAVFMPLLPRRWLMRAMLGWLFAPLGLMIAMFLLLLIVGAGSPSGGVANSLLAVGYIGIFVLVPWFVVALLGLGLGLVTRRLWGRRSPGSSPMAEDTPPPAAPPTTPPPAASPSPPAVRRAVTLAPFDGMTTAQLHDRIRERARNVGMEDACLSLIGQPQNSKHYAFVDHHGMQLGYFERGDMSGDRTTRDLDEMLYWVFDCITFDMAAKAARDELAQTGEIGALLLARQGELLARIDPGWHARWLKDPFCRASPFRREAKP